MLIPCARLRTSRPKSVRAIEKTPSLKVSINLWLICLNSLVMWFSASKWTWEQIIWKFLRFHRLAQKNLKTELFFLISLWTLRIGSSYLFSQLTFFSFSNKFEYLHNVLFTTSEPQLKPSICARFNTLFSLYLSFITAYNGLS